jgi:tetratricopeptide (TPR) repeat protein
MRTIAQWALIIAALAGVAMAQPTEAEKRADALFQEGRRLLEAGEVATACPKFEESQRLDPGLGTLLNLANCYERTERLASALAAFRSAEEGARAAGDRTREREASDRARALESRVSRVTIKLAPGERAAGRLRGPPQRRRGPAPRLRPRDRGRSRRDRDRGLGARPHGVSPVARDRRRPHRRADRDPDAAAGRGADREAATDRRTGRDRPDAPDHRRPAAPGAGGSA